MTTDVTTIEAQAAQDLDIAEDDRTEVIDAPAAAPWAEMVYIRECLEQLRHMLAKEYDQPDQWYYTTLTATQTVKIKRNGRRHIYLLTPNTLANLTINASGLVTTATLNSGWNPLPYPDQTTIQLATGAAAQVVLIRRTNALMAPGVGNGGSVQGVGAPVAVTTTGNTNAGSATTLNFASAVNHWTLQNNSTANIYYTTDGTAASTGSLVLAPNAQIVYDWPLSSISVFTASAIAINGASGLQLVGRA